MLVEVVLRGTSPLLMNKMAASVLEGLGGGKKPPKAAKVGSTKTPREVAETKVHLSEEGPYIPGYMLMACLIGAGQHVRLDGKRQISTQKSTVLPGLMTLLTTAPLLKVPGTDKAAGWEADVMQGRNPNGGEAVAIYRPRFDAWGLTVRIDIEENEVGELTIRELFDKAGRRCGLGDFRPQRRGTFGQFVVECWDHVESEVEAQV